MKKGEVRYTYFGIAPQGVGLARPYHNSEGRPLIRRRGSMMRRVQGREWLKTRVYVVTKSLREKLNTVKEDEREKFCIVQNKVLTATDEFDEEFAAIDCSYWKRKLGKGYRRSIDEMKEWGELDVDEIFIWSKDKTGVTKNYAVPLPAARTGTCNVEFERRRVRLPVPNNTPTDAASEYALQCLNQLEVRKHLVYPPPEDPSKNAAKRKSRIREHCEHIVAGDFSLHYGPKVKRLYHRVVLMPKEGRCNLEYHRRLVEYDVQTCHPVLLLSLFSDADERKTYADMLVSDIYKRIGEDMGVSTRQQVKHDFQRIVNTGQKRLGWMLEQYPFKFYVYHFPKFAKVLHQRTDLANFLQNFEARLMVQVLGNYCRSNGLFWIPMHDGFMSTQHDGELISAFAREVFFRAVNFTPTIYPDHSASGS